MPHCVLSGRTEIDWVNDVSVVNALLAAAPNYRLVGSATSGYFAVAADAAADADFAPLYRFVLLQVRIVIATFNNVAFVVLQVA
jgi:hypothetical protein